MKFAALAIAAATTAAAPLTVAPCVRVTMQIPRQQTTEYHFPYVAIWIERPDQTAVNTLTVWYDRRSPEGERYLQDLRTWWRSIGNQMTWEADGVSGATRAPGINGFAMLGSNPVLRTLPRGDYNIAIEASREGGGHEIVRAPLRWDGRTRTVTASGTSEIGAVTVEIYP
jgi:hypothetical protein